MTHPNSKPHIKREMSFLELFSVRSFVSSPEHGGKILNPTARKDSGDYNYTPQKCFISSVSVSARGDEKTGDVTDWAAVKIRETSLFSLINENSFRTWLLPIIIFFLSLTVGSQLHGKYGFSGLWATSSALGVVILLVALWWFLERSRTLEVPLPQGATTALGARHMSPALENITASIIFHDYTYADKAAKFIKATIDSEGNR